MTNSDISTGFMRVDKVTAGSCMLLLANACFLIVCKSYSYISHGYLSHGYSYIARLLAIMHSSLYAK